MTRNAPLAIDSNGERFDVPEEAAGWRVRRFAKSGKGMPETLFRDGDRLVVPITADAAELLEALRHSVMDEIAGKYRLDAIDEDGDACCDVPAYTVFGSKPVAEHASRQQTENMSLTKALECNLRMVNCLVDAVKTISTQYAAAMESSARAASLRAHYAPPLPEPPPALPVPVEPASDDPVTQQHTVDWTPLVEQCAPIVSQFGAMAAAKFGSKIMGMDVPPSGPGGARPPHSPDPDDEL